MTTEAICRAVTGLYSCAGVLCRGLSARQWSKQGVRTYSVPFADAPLVSLAADMPGLSWVSQDAAAGAGHAIHGALRAPLGMPTLTNWSAGDRVCIAVTDATRACPDSCSCRRFVWR